MVAVQLSVVIVSVIAQTFKFELTGRKFGTVVAYWLDYGTIRNLTGTVREQFPSWRYMY